ncbi:MAG TPA: hypothetical protein VHA13_06260, partial [Gammaproteobacteria bacterium]|nr:hypothetical protein [Gammaproteobacteria bacterium]
EALRQYALEACIKGCSLKELRQMISQQKELTKKQKRVSLEVKGNKALGKRINMGFTDHMQVVREIVEAVLGQNRYQKYSPVFSTIDWTQAKHTALAFRQLIDILEQETVEQV